MPAEGPHRVLVTGATGFVGGHLLERLARSGYALRAAVRDPRARLPPEVEVVPVGDLGAHTEWAAALRGVDTVVHLAARVHVMRAGPGDAAAFEATNVAGSARLAGAAAAAGVRRFVFLSSIKVHGEETGGRPFAATDAPDPRDAYARSKLAAEVAIRRACAGAPMSAAVIRPPLVYGRGAGGNFRRLARLVERGVPLPLASVDNRRSLVSAWNLCDLVERVIAARDLPERALLVSDGADVSTADLLRGMAKALGKPARLYRCPPGLLLALARLTGTQEAMRRLLGSLRVDIEDTRAALGWTPGLSLQAGLERALA